MSSYGYANVVKNKSVSEVNFSSDVIIDDIPDSIFMGV